ncbi:hypothetical protein TFLX_01466 [Thermoflexales bacterium]|nr:hypothetical protein TFLX_01466 [Thermoflexales bacterium]
MEAPVVAVELPADLYAELQSLTAQENAKDPVDMIVRLVAEAQEKHVYLQPPPAFQRILDRATDLGLDDLSEQHDHYLYGTDKQ